MVSSEWGWVVVNPHHVHGVIMIKSHAGRGGNKVFLGRSAPGSDAPIVDGDTVHERQVPVVCQEEQVVDPRHGRDLSIRRRDRSALGLLLGLNAPKLLCRQRIKRP